MIHGKRGHIPKFYGAATVGERGQVAIPQEARRDCEITPNMKLLVFSGPGKNALMLVKAESVAEMMADATATLAHLEKVLKSDDIQEAAQES